ncbi:conjugal transfer protein TraI [Marinilongibacter aquaticus]|uniref:conjugal transfer protein TraI n=1 Tax=Marinilongibacter aquaticus TaxID=2975157 RepID=UPI0021BD86C2|nr:conjugal transfer protein TraI [Marinilongibacter aquaticus]UBM58720.1 conjugal transfer protein TraI [Marinilongibacter aquaticus]
MKRNLGLVLMTVVLSAAPTGTLRAANPIIEIIKAAVIKVIKALDLVIQQLQNKTIWLQNAQKELENILSESKLKEIADWAERQRQQYREYYQELRQVKKAISDYHRVKTVLDTQRALVAEYGRMWNLLRVDGNFTADELSHMAGVYGGILSESLKNVDHISLILKDMATQMTDADRMELIDAAGRRIERNYDDLRLFNRQNILLSLQRARARQELRSLRKAYGLQ